MHKRTSYENSSSLRYRGKSLRNEYQEEFRLLPAYCINPPRPTREARLQEHAYHGDTGMLLNNPTPFSCGLGAPQVCRVRRTATRISTSSFAITQEQPVGLKMPMHEHGLGCGPHPNDDDCPATKGPSFAKKPSSVGLREECRRSSVSSLHPLIGNAGLCQELLSPFAISRRFVY